MARWYSDTTQIAWVCEMLIQGKEISHKCEIKAVNGWRLSAVIHILFKKMGWPIIHRDGKNGIRFYRLKPDADINALKKPKSYLAYLEKKRLIKEKGAGTPLSNDK